MKRLFSIATTVVALTFAGPALAMPPSLTSVSHQQRQPTVTFSAPHASAVTVYFATKPDLATDGSFLQQNVRETGILTPADIRSGTWIDPNRVDHGTYYVMLKAQANFDACYVGPGLDPLCADGYSNVLTLVVEKPAIRYAVEVKAYRKSGVARLMVTATPMGEKTPYRVCYRMAKKARRCVAGTLDGYSWDRPVQNALYVRTDLLATFTTFTWYVGGKKVGEKRARIR
jgi:hypothetical protein